MEAPREKIWKYTNEQHTETQWKVMMYMQLVLQKEKRENEERITVWRDNGWIENCEIDFKNLQLHI